MYFFPSGWPQATISVLAIGFAFATGAQDAQPGSSQAPRAIVQSVSHDFGRAEQGSKLLHQFTIANSGASPLVITRVALSTRGMTAKIKPSILPGKEETLTIEWDTAGAKGALDGKAVLDVNDPATPQLVFVLSADVQPGVEFLPYQAIFTSVYQGEAGQRTVRLVNHRMQPLTIDRIEQQGEHFHAAIRPIEPGRVYELDVTVPESVPPGRYTEAVFVYGNDPKMPRYMVPVNVIVKADISVNPETVDFGHISSTEVAKSPSSLDLLRQTIIVRKRAGKFSITSVTSDASNVRVERSPDGNISSDAFRLDVALEKAGLRPGRIEGTIRIRTDDERFPELVVPLRGVIE